nr:homeodomain transcription factor bW [Pseudozyma thailandica]
MPANCLQQIRQIAGALSEVYPRRHSSALELSNDHQLALPTLRLAYKNPHRLQATLKGLPINSDAIDAITNVFKDAQAKLMHACNLQYTESADGLQDHGADAKFLDKFRFSVENRFEQGVYKLEQSVLEMIESIISSKPLLQSTRSESQKFSGVPSMMECTSARRGHDSTAVHILEQAFQHTPNITQAEKYRLAEVTGLQPKQVTIWFQNRRNRKGKKPNVKAPTTPPPLSRSPLNSPSRPDSPSTALPFAEKKRKNYGSISMSPSPSFPSTPSSSFDESSLVKKRCLPRLTSDTSDASFSSLELNSSFIPWSSPSSRSTSSSSASSSPSDCFDSPVKAQNLFRYTNPSKREDMVMPTVTIPAQSSTSLHAPGQGERSPFTSDNVSSGASSSFSFAALQNGMDRLSADLRASVHRAFELHDASQNSSRNTSWGSQLSAMDDDAEWVDDDESIVGGAAGSAPRFNTPNYGLEQQQGSASNLNNSMQAFAQAQHPTLWPPNPSHVVSGDSSLDSTRSYPTENDNFDINQFIASSQPSSQPSSEPSSQHTYQQHANPNSRANMQQSQSAPPSQNNSEDLSMDFAMDELVGLDELLSLFSQNQSEADSMVEDGEGGHAGAQVRLNFDQSSNMFSLA